jgi:hypothetical protein
MALTTVSQLNPCALELVRAVRLAGWLANTKQPLAPALQWERDRIHRPASRGNVHSADGWDGTLKPVVARYQHKESRIYFRADAAFATPGVYEYLEAERIKYAIRLPANQVLQDRIGYLLKRPVGRPPNEVRRFHANFSYRAGS